ncbi:SMI1/KNR4 family protein [Hymenobacter sp. HMF4947]|uniref:SMI1/KNR4 family protein n=1 Tax=Hymenobacter ginkgonis TaxID=2682976 RepID=A0A7K1TKE8_9BACT|nr:SMI1/KNR4 family protein [Hymenobacter ginkgonis]MVN78890.1 SMI1/KNR4 family protein [Hymenobacter ginkgonis]
MAMDLTTFWDETATVPPALTQEFIQQAEQQLGVRLPADLLALLRQQNGGYTRGFVYPMTRPTSWATTHVPFDELFGLLPSDTGATSILDSGYLTQEGGVPEKQVLLSGDGHWFITLDYRHGSEPRVAWIDTEMDEDVPVADSFPAFLAGLIDRDDLPDDED